MQEKHIKDLVIAIAVIMLLVFTINDYSLYNKVNKVKKESIYANIALDEGLLAQIQSIEKSITDRKSFTFTVTKDPLLQDLIVKTKQDLQKQWEEMVSSMMRLSATFTDSDGQKKAMVSYGGKNHLLGIGDVLANRKITKIESDRIHFSEGNYKGEIVIQKIPPKPKELDENAKEKQYNW
ncbi:MAG TPA: hypothetical protein PL063_02350 [Candidatus Cloacimonadota bacterium]|nr:hypothetical protein [Candidatus Cloacimonadota bacterium]HQB40569.1 hypothetical protein [Candidatus Cloacimonadota bacterium]